MPISLAFRFLAGRYHATPYGHHVNEGLIEWPPSPWRLLRALISVGYTSGVWNSSGPPITVRRLIEKMAAGLPCYRLPRARGAHSRHYMPIGVLNGNTKREKTTLVFDAWVRVEDQELVVTWDNLCLNADESSVLRALVEHLNYLGRAESWVESRILVEGEPKAESNCIPESHGVSPGRGWEQVALLAPTSANDFAAWRDRQLEEAWANLTLPEARKPSKTLLRKRAKAAEPYPDDLLDCMQKNTTWLRSHGWSQPPGSRRVFYWRPSGAISVSAPKKARTSRNKRRVQAMLLSLTNASRNDHALPPVTRTLPQADLLHRALVGTAAKLGTPPTELTGRDGHRQPLQGPHQHAHINPLDLDGDGHLDHVLIWAPMGLGGDAQDAIRGVRRTFFKGGIDPLRLALAAVGNWDDLHRLPGRFGHRIFQLTSDGTTWQSLTPFVVPRYLKARGKNTIEGQIRAELDSRGFPQPSAVHQLAPIPRHRSDGSTPAATGESTWSRFRHYQLARHHGPQPTIACGFAIRLEFDRPVTGPIALGYGSHFGLGLFHAVPTKDHP